MISKFQPFSLTKDIGEEYNAHCEGAKDWILILDYDVLILDYRAYFLMEKAIYNEPDCIFSCYASRIGYQWQRIWETWSENDSFLHHQKIAKEQADKYPNGETRPIQTAAGFFLLFHKSYWERNRFQPKMIDSSGRMFDRVFCDEAMKKNKVRLIQGIYVWHTYRLGRKPNDTSHLF